MFLLKVRTFMVLEFKIKYYFIYSKVLVSDEEAKFCIFLNITLDPSAETVASEPSDNYSHAVSMIQMR